jgi:hypothetical protein
MVLHVHSQGYIVPNGVTILPGPTRSEIHVIQNPTNGDYTGFTFDSQGGDTFLFNPFLDEQVRTFLVSANDPVSLQPILSHAYPELTYPNTYAFSQGNPFYLGFYTGYAPQSGIYSNPVFGWGEFVNNSGVIELLDSGLEIQGGGIYAGSQTIIEVPEPRMLAVLAIGGAMLGCCSMRRLKSKRVRVQGSSPKI